MTASANRDLQIDTDPGYQVRMWTIERIGWAAIALILSAAAAGLFGHGLLSNAVVSQAGFFHFEYERFGRFHSPLTLRLSVEPPAWQDGSFSVWLSDDYLRSVELGTMTPSPDAVRQSRDGLRFQFPAGEGCCATIVLRLQADTVGLLSGSLRINDNPPVSFQHYIHP